MSTKIEWTNETWNPVTGCYGPGGSADKPRRCGYCYAYRMARRLAGRYGYPESPHFFDPTFHPNRLEKPFSWKKPRMVFVCSMADLFGPWVPDGWIESVLGIVAQTPRHTYQFLTKWPERLERWNPWPDNAWVGASVTNIGSLQKTIPWLQNVYAPVRFVSAEPWLGTVENPQWRNIPLLRSLLGRIQWFIIGQQTGPGARSPDRVAINTLVEAARLANTAVFMKPPLADTWQDAPQEWPVTTE
jgi:protein gp37